MHSSIGLFMKQWSARRTNNLTFLQPAVEIHKSRNQDFLKSWFRLFSYNYSMIHTKDAVIFSETGNVYWRA